MLATTAAAASTITAMIDGQRSASSTSSSNNMASSIIPHHHPSWRRITTMIIGSVGSGRLLYHNNDRSASSTLSSSMMIRRWLRIDDAATNHDVTITNSSRADDDPATRETTTASHIKRVVAVVADKDNNDDPTTTNSRERRRMPSTGNNQQQIPLGQPLPYDEHACSVSLPTWSDVVGYEEGDVEVSNALKTGYPRFVYHPYVIKLMDIILERYAENKNEDCLVLPTAEAALRCQAFLRTALLNQSSTKGGAAPIVDNALIGISTERSPTKDDDNNDNSMIRIVHLENDQQVVHAVLFPATTMAGSEAKAYWQHTGEIVSSRRAELAVSQIMFSDDNDDVELLPRVTTTTTTTDNDDNNTAPKHVCYHSSFTTICDDDPDEKENENDDDDPHHRNLQRRLAGLAGVEQNDVFLAPSGMASIYLALRSSRRYQMQQKQMGKNDGGTSIVFGFPYLDTLKLCSRAEICPGGVEFFGRGDAHDLNKLERLLLSNNYNKSYCALITEVPSNPLLQTPDLAKLRQLSDEHDMMLIVDDTIGNFCNVNVLQYADAVCTSLTKLVSGRGDAIAGSVVCNTNRPGGRWMQHDLASDNNNNKHHNGLLAQDALAILRNATDFETRNSIINKNAERLADWFVHEQTEYVERVYYPKYSSSRELYHQLQKQQQQNDDGGGYGGLMSILLHDHVCQRHFYDALQVAKGPSLGTNFTLVCPYTLLAHYHELDFAMSYNVPPNLLRIAVGMEPIDELLEKFDAALKSSRLYPKISMPGRQKRLFSTTTAVFQFSGRRPQQRRLHGFYCAQYALRRLVGLMR